MTPVAAALPAGVSAGQGGAGTPPEAVYSRRKAGKAGSHGGEGEHYAAATTASGAAGAGVTQAGAPALAPGRSGEARAGPRGSGLPRAASQPSLSASDHQHQSLPVSPRAVAAAGSGPFAVRGSSNASLNPAGRSSVVTASPASVAWREEDKALGMALEREVRVIVKKLLAWDKQGVFMQPCSAVNAAVGSSGAAVGGGGGGAAAAPSARSVALTAGSSAGSSAVTATGDPGSLADIDARWQGGGYRSVEGLRAALLGRAAGAAGAGGSASGIVSPPGGGGAAMTVAGGGGGGWGGVGRHGLAQLDDDVKCMCQGIFR